MPGGDIQIFEPNRGKSSKRRVNRETQRIADDLAGFHVNKYRAIAIVEDVTFEGFKAAGDGMGQSLILGKFAYQAPYARGVFSFCRSDHFLPFLKNLRSSEKPPGPRSMSATASAQSIAGK